jgi:hypothetical protein
MLGGEPHFNAATQINKDGNSLGERRIKHQNLGLGSSYSASDEGGLKTKVRAVINL